MNDRALRNIVIGLGGKANGIPRESSFQITVASEIMAALCLATSLSDLKDKIRSMVFGYARDGKALKVGDLKIEGAIAALLKRSYQTKPCTNIRKYTSIYSRRTFCKYSSWMQLYSSY